MSSSTLVLLLLTCCCCCCADRALFASSARWCQTSCLFSLFPAMRQTPAAPPPRTVSTHFNSDDLPACLHVEAGSSASIREYIIYLDLHRHVVKECPTRRTTEQGGQSSPSIALGESGRPNSLLDIRLLRTERCRLHVVPGLQGMEHRPNAPIASANSPGSDPCSFSPHVPKV